MIKTTVTGADDAAAVLKKALQDFMTNQVVTVGIHEDGNGRDSGEITNASLGAIHEFGATIEHPGGTDYGYSTQKDAENGKVRFMKSGEGFMTLGRTEAHQIDIPARPWLEPGVASGNVQYLKIIEAGLKNGETLDEILPKIGAVAVANVQVYMTELKSPPNAASTIARKGSSNPLISSGVLRSSVDMKVQNVMPEEGL